MYEAAYNKLFNTQPPEGGWRYAITARPMMYSFNTQPPEGGWASDIGVCSKPFEFQHTAA